MEINKKPLLDYSSFQIDVKELTQRNKLEPSGMTSEELLRLRAESEYNRMKATMLSAHSIEEDLYSCASSSGINIVSDRLHLINPVTDDTANTRFTDCQFINNFVVKESFYRDQIEKNYSGDELQAKLREFKAISDKVINDISEKYADSYRGFF